MKVLITGIDGFVAYHLTELLAREDVELYGTTILEDYRHDIAKVYQMNLLDYEVVHQVLDEIRPDYIYHLAGQSDVGLSWKKPTLTMNINVNGTLHLLEAIRDLELKSRVLIIGSSDQYGPIKEEECPIGEDKPMKPASPYGISKKTQEEMARLYARAYGIDVVMVRAFNHIGPRQGKNFVVSDFASKIAEIEKGAEPVLQVGNLKAYRDFTDVRDIVRGYKLLMEKGHRGETYNIGSGKAIAIQEILDVLVGLSTVPIDVVIDKEKLRPIDVPLVQCDNTKLKAHTGWEIANEIHHTLKDTLDYWRENV